MAKYKAYLGVLFVFTLSYLRENYFLVLNGVINNNDSYKANIQIPNFLYSFSINQLIILKWTSAVVFLFLFLVLSRYVIANNFNNKLITKITTYLFILICAISGLLFLLSVYISDSLYTFAHILLTILISPLYLLGIFPIMLFYTNQNIRN